ncbi:MAG: glycosyltransferase family 4 protein [Acidimicrobiales bacterium]|nr:glycosyltransferase family 4 protein [Acidimicrobiales bacterium]
MTAIGTAPLWTPAAKPRLVHVTTTDMSLDWLLRPQLEAFAAAGYEVIGVSAPGPHVEALEASGIEHVPALWLTRSMAVSSDLKALGELYRIFRRLQPTIVHTHNPKPGVLGRIAARAAGVPVVVNTVHGLYAQPEDRWSKRLAVYGAERLAAANSDMELVQNPEDVVTLRSLRLPRDRVALLGNGVDLDRFQPGRLTAAQIAEGRQALGIASGEVVAGVVGRLVNEKGYREVLGAAHQLRTTHPKLRVVIVGPSEPDKADAVDPALVARAEADGVLFLGQRDDVEELYGLFDFYVLASYREGFPRSAMEAAASGIPLIVTDIRGGRQVVDDGVTGRLVPVRDTDALARAMGQLAEDEVARRRMAAAGLGKARREFDQQRQIDVTLAAYARLLGR